jgi:GSH-dependent disulfide-bond oxidoreductase
MVDLIYVANPIAQGLTILLEECKPTGLQYGTFYLPTITTDIDNFPPLLLDESPFGAVEISHPAAAMVYLAEKAKYLKSNQSPEFLQLDPVESFAAVRWTMWQTAAQAFRPRGESDGKVAERADRLCAIVNEQLGNTQKYLAGTRYTMADMMCYPWVANWLAGAAPSEQYGHLYRWFLDLGSREAVKAGMEAGGKMPRSAHPLGRAIEIMAQRLPGTHSSKLP